MNEEIMDAAPNAEEVATPNVEEEVVAEETVETPEELQARLAKAEELANNYKIRAERAEKKAKEVPAGTPKATAPSVSGDLSAKDLYAFMEAKVPQEDIDDVREYASMKGISVTDALKSNVVKTILSDKREMRNTASAANVGPAKRSKGQVAEDVLIEKAKKGEMPESDADLMRLVRARKGKK